ncbi:FxsA family protein [Mycobacterium sp. 1081908.1]|uniref:FxsA family protein n=1 Tax=Mycobacterium sp. 1081908.1 TaxID=1834066 RepID=UPI0007FE946D|nr:FxsA family protein [Mycobacterium sp. 1081908.1]OBK43660.1 membrane protein FxsA [Mycobacterium sp. 1081908.1]
MMSRLFLIYAAVELAAVAALVSSVGWGWTLLALLATFMLGWVVLAPMAGSQLIRQIGQLRSGLADPRRAAGDGAMVTLAMALVLVPGLVTTALGLLLLVPPIRKAARPGLTAMALRGVRRRAPLITDATLFGADPREGRDYIDGEVVDVRDFRAPALPNDMRGGYPGNPAWD